MRLVQRAVETVGAAWTVLGLCRRLPGGCIGMFHCLDDDGKRSYAAAAHRATRPGATLLLSCFSDANPSDEEWPRPAVSEQTLRDVLGGAGWDIETLEPATRRREIDGDAIEMAFWYVRAQRRTLT